uniref:Integrase catalytic domain-containing protein n=1 Tax=Tanacetum cinerariifolium TaxID=118510 RepID=A0A6L2JHN1_TANCI|nr:hypothetical protein [Tanacetum cinerariifolium]
MKKTVLLFKRESNTRASCKTKTENSITLPLHLLHMDLFGPTFIKSLMKKMYCLVVTDYYSRFTWVFFLTTKDETSGILKSFITRIENLVDHKVKVIRCDNGTEFKNREMNQFCEMKGILRQFSVARTPQQDGVAEGRNRTLIKAARTMLADSKLPTTFWKEAINTACYVQNRVLVVNPHNKTSYELFHGRRPTLSFMRPFGCPITIINTKDHLGKFDGKANESFFIGYSLNSKAFREFNSTTRIVEENLHIRFSKTTPNVVGSGPDWLFDIDALTRTMNYEPIVAGTQSNSFAGTKVSDNTSQARKETEPVKYYILLPLWIADLPFSQDLKSSQDDGFKPLNDDGKKVDKDLSKGIEYNKLPFDPNMPSLEDVGTFDFSNEDEDDDAVADIINLDTTIQVSHTPTTRIYKDHPLDQVIRDLHSATQTRNMTKNLEEHEFLSIIHQRTNHKDLQNCLFACFLSQEEPKKTLVDLPNGKRAIGTKSVFKNKKDERGIVIRNKARLVAQGYTKEEGIDYDKVFAPVARIKAIRLFLAYALFKDFMVYQMDVKSAFLYGKIKKEVYVCQLPGFEDPDFPNRVYKVEKALYGLHQAPRAWGTYILLGITKVKNASTPMETQKPLLKDEDGKEVDVYMYRLMIGSLMYLTSSRPDIMLASKKQTVASNSTTKAKYVAASSYCGQVLWIQNQLLDYGRDLRLADEEGVDCLSDSTIFENLELMGTMASVIIYLAINQKFNFSKLIFDSMIRNLDNVSGKFLMYPRNPKRKNTQVPQPSGSTEHVANEAVYKELDDRLVRAASTASSLEAEQGSGDIDKTQSKATPNEASSPGTTLGGGPRGNTLRNDEDRMKLNELMKLCTNLQSRVLDLERTKTTQALEITRLKKRVKKLEKKQRSKTRKLKRLYTVTLVNDQDDAEMFDVNDLHGEEVFVEKEVMDKEVNAAGEVNAASIATTDSADKGKGIMVEEPMKLKKKDQIRLDEETALKLQAEFDGEEQRLARERAQKKLEANIALIETWDDVQTKINLDYQMAKRLQAGEQQELTIKEKATLFMQLLEKRRKFFTAKRAEEKRNKLPTQAQQRKIMCTYLKNVEGKKLKDLKNTTGEVLTQESAKKQKVKDDKETAEYKQLMEIIFNEEGVVINVIPLAVKSLRIVDGKIYKEGKKRYYQIIRAEGNSKMYMFFRQMLKSFNREDLKDLYKLVKAKYGSTRPVEDLDLLLLGDLKTMFELHVEDVVWRKQQEYKV